MTQRHAWTPEENAAVRSGRAAAEVAAEIGRSTTAVHVQRTKLKQRMADGLTAYPVRGGCCPHCGRQKPQWTPEAIVKAARRWWQEYQRSPRSTEWEHAKTYYPTRATVMSVFESWNAMLRTAKLPIVQRKQWTQEDCIQALFEDTFRRGRVPLQSEWNYTDREHDRPTNYTIRNHFGTWNTFLVAAGYQPTKKWSKHSFHVADGLDKPNEQAA